MRVLRALPLLVLAACGDDTPNLPVDAAAIDAAPDANQAPELRTFAIKTGTSYWLLVGAKAATGGLPAAYTVSLCGETFTP